MRDATLFDLCPVYREDPDVQSLLSGYLLRLNAHPNASGVLKAPQVTVLYLGLAH